MSTQLIRRQLRDFINFPLAGRDENWKQLEKIMAKGGNDNDGRAKKIMVN